MKKRFSVGLILLGLLFIFLSMYAFTGSYNLLKRGINFQVASIQRTSDDSIKALREMKTEETKQKLEALGNIESFNKEYDILETKLVQFKEDCPDFIPEANKRILLSGFVAAFFCFFAGCALIIRSRWERVITMVSCFFFLLYYVLTWMAIYPSFYMMQFMVDHGNAMSLLIDPDSMDYAGYVGKSAIGNILFGFPFVVFHFFMITVVGGAMFILSRVKVKELLRK